MTQLESQAYDELTITIILNYLLMIIVNDACLSLTSCKCVDSYVPLVQTTCAVHALDFKHMIPNGNDFNLNTGYYVDNPNTCAACRMLCQSCTYSTCSVCLNSIETDDYSWNMAYYLSSLTIYLAYGILCQTDIYTACTAIFDPTEAIYSNSN